MAVIRCYRVGRFLLLGAAAFTVQTGCSIAPAVLEANASNPAKEVRSHVVGASTSTSVPPPSSEEAAKRRPDPESSTANARPDAEVSPAAASSMSRAEPTSGQVHVAFLLSDLESKPPSAEYPSVDHLGVVVDERPTAKKIDLTAEPDDLWDRIRNGFGMPDLYGQMVGDRENWYAKQARALEKVLERTKLYLYHIVQELEIRGMPMELALLPLVESSFDPMATSRANASGLWQFIPSTGARYKLRQDTRYDARRDIIASTDAALDYLSFLYETHGDWHLALASYNWGENAVARAIKRNRANRLPTDYAHLRMPRETRLYVPKLQALKNIISSPDTFGVDLDAIPNRPFFINVKVEEIDIRLAAKFAEMPCEDILALNPGHKGPVFQGGRTAELLLPANRAKTFLANLSSYKKPLVSWKRYRLKPADSLARLAKLHGISPAQLRKANGLYTSTSLKAGTLLFLPMKQTRATRLGRQGLTKKVPRIVERKIAQRTRGDAK